MDFDKMNGLVPAIIQDADTAKVLMLGFMNKEAYDKTVETGKVTFFSRTKNRLWTKGEESGNFLNVVSIKGDCDRDTLLGAFGFEVGSVSVEDIHIFARDVDVAEEIIPHKAVIAFGMIFGEADIFVHIECHHIAERHLAFFIEFDKAAVHAKRRRAGGTAENERFLGCRGCGIDARCNIVAGPD